uniref:Uncharacterized protein n=1 Tax=Rhizophora mucronata TaxID=61149 RepID=A0A2P2IWA5_RHIMU
MELVLKNRECE